MFTGFWWGLLQLVYGPTADWVDAIAVVMTLAFPLAAIAIAFDLAKTVDRAWPRLIEIPAASAALVGGALWVALALTVAVAGFRSAAALVGLTLFWDAVSYGLLFGVGGLFMASVLYRAVPALTGRRLYSDELARRFLRWTVVGVGGTVLLLALAGLAAGYGWTGGSFVGGFADVGSGWAQTAGVPRVISGFAILTAGIALAGQLALVLNVYRTVTSSHPGAAEVLVFKEDPT